MKKGITRDEIRKSVTSISETAKMRNVLQEAGSIQKEWADTLSELPGDREKGKGKMWQNAALQARAEEERIKWEATEGKKRIKALQMKARDLTDDYDKVDNIRTDDDFMDYIGSSKRH